MIRTTFKNPQLPEENEEYKLYHHSLCPFSRKVRIHLSAKDIKFQLITENFWEKRKEFMIINPACTTPVLIDGHLAVSDSSVIIEYIEEKENKTKNFLGNTLETRAEVRRVQSWFDNRFYIDVTRQVLKEKYLKRFDKKSFPNPEILRVAKNNARIHFDYITYLLESSKYLACDQISVADFAGAAQISVLDYFGDIEWNHIKEVKDWYSLVKSHKFFNEILQDRISNLSPPSWYAKADF